MKTEATAQHRWLQQLLGEWRAEGEAPGPAGEPPISWKSEETVRAIGELWVQGEGRGEMPDGTPSLTQMTLGYDESKQRFVGSWLGSMMSYLWVYEGELDESQTVLTLNTVGPDMSGEDLLAHYRDVITLHDKNHRSLTSHMQGPDGEWRAFMTAHYYRK